MNPTQLVQRKISGEAIPQTEMASFINAYVDEKIGDDEMTPFLKAVHAHGMTDEETIILTDIMLNSGDRLAFSNMDAYVADKHSTGGVGDKVSMVLGPLMAAAGLAIPMLTGRSLGHTGGTTDKLETIPGFQTSLTLDQFKANVETHGICIMGQTESICPADRKIYALRDVTDTIDSIPLICGSIMSKKIAEGIQGLVLDIKTGNGAFADNLDFAGNMGNCIIEVAKQFGMNTSAIITDMNQPLGGTVGNTLEIIEVIDYLKCVQQESRLHEVVLTLAAEMLAVAGLVDSTDDGFQKAKEVLDSGKAAETFEKMVSELGGPNNILENTDSHFESASVVKPVLAHQSGFISQINTRAVGLTVVELGGGRKKASDSIDHSVGLSNVLGLGTKVDVGQPLAIVHAQNEDQANIAIQQIQNLFILSEIKAKSSPVIIDHLNSP